MPRALSLVLCAGRRVRGVRPHTEARRHGGESGCAWGWKGEKALVLQGFERGRGVLRDEPFVMRSRQARPSRGGVRVRSVTLPKGQFGVKKIFLAVTRMGVCRRLSRRCEGLGRSRRHLFAIVKHSIAARLSRSFPVVTYCNLLADFCTRQRATPQRIAPNHAQPMLSAM